MYKLISIAISHYNEKARWGLDYFAQRYHEAGYMPVLHMPAVAWATRGASDAREDRVSTRFSTPVLICPDGERICDSTRILRYLDLTHRGERASLYASPDCDKLEAYLQSDLGAHSRRLAYFYLLDDTDLMRQAARENVGKVQAQLFRAMLPLGRGLLKKSLKVNEKHALRSRDKVLDTFDCINEMLSDNRPFLLGDRFSAADLSFACMAAPSLLVTRVEGYGAHLPSPEEAGGLAYAFAQQLRASPAGAHAMRMFREQRTPSSNGAKAQKMQAL